MELTTAPILTPRYQVELIVEGRSHKYKVTPSLGHPENFSIFPGVTGALDILGGEKTQRLMGWAKKEALAVVRAQLDEKLGGADARRTTLTKVGLDEIFKLAWKRPQKIKDDAADLGTRAHQYIDRIIRGEKFDLKSVPSELWPALSSFLEWWEGSGIEIIAGDTKVASIFHGYGGSLDAMGRRPHGSLVLLDWKTASAIHDDYALQVAAYARAAEETFGVDIPEAIVVRFPKKAPFEFDPKKDARTVLDIKRSFSCFLDALRLSQQMKLEHFA